MKYVQKPQQATKTTRELKNKHGHRKTSLLDVCNRLASRVDESMLARTNESVKMTIGLSEYVIASPVYSLQRQPINCKANDTSYWFGGLA